MPIRCEIVSQDRIVFQGDADMVIIPGAEGVMGILPHHSPVLSVLQYGIITVRSQLSEQYFTVAGGIVEVQPDQVTVLADAAENVAEIDEMRAQEARARAEEQLKARGQVDEDADEFLALQSALRRSNLRLDAIRRHKSTRRNQQGQ
jgi:F-type H+-transporting ATPase subunit epsilon